jgi:hypothetical protein
MNFNCVLLVTTGTSVIDQPVCLVPAQNVLAMGRKRVAQFHMMIMSFACACQVIQVDTVIVLVSECLFCDCELFSFLDLTPS